MQPTQYVIYSMESSGLLRPVRSYFCALHKYSMVGNKEELFIKICLLISQFLVTPLSSLIESHKQCIYNIPLEVRDVHVSLSTHKMSSLHSG